ncbi:MAG TPA: UPF0280 family protein [Caldimonas sp.]|nr:UPF0280 family protein [Caldimonas sp.]
MSTATRRPLGDGRWLFQHGPIDCVILAEGRPEVVAACRERAWQRFRGVLDELVGELPLLRTDLGSAAGACVAPAGSIARRMVAACRPHARDGRFITAMAAVAGSVAEELIGAFDEAGIARASINNGGDIALHLGPSASFDVGVVADPAIGRAAVAVDGHFRIDAASPVRGIATSGWRGRSFSLGIADSVTVLAASASVADAAATVIANAVDIADARIVRRPANEFRDDSDLGGRLVVRGVPALAPEAIGRALTAGAAVARGERTGGRIIAAVLSLQGRFLVVDADGPRAVAAAASRAFFPAADPERSFVHADRRHAHAA